MALAMPLISSFSVYECQHSLDQIWKLFWVVLSLLLTSLCENQVNWTVDAILDPTNHTWESAAICRLLPPKFPDTRMNELRISIRPEVN